MKTVTGILSACLLIAGCGGTAGDGTTTSALSLEDVQEEIDEFEERMAEMPDCPTEAGDVLTSQMVDEGCMEGDEWVFPGVWDCADGRQLWSKGNLWGWVGEPAVETDSDSASDPGYVDAYGQCSP